MHTFLQDARFGLRSWKSTPGFTIAAILCLALGIGATTAIFSVVNAVLVRPLPYKNPDSLVRVYTEFPTFPNGGLHRFWMSAPELLDLRRVTKSWESLDGWIIGGTNIAGATSPTRVTSAQITGGLLPTLGISPIMGRVITPEDDKPGASLTAVISYGLWKSAFGGDPAIAGRETLINGQKANIVGVMPQGFAFPPGEVDPPQIWVPLQIDPANPGGRGSHNYYILGRLKPGVSVEQARSEMDSLVRAWGETKAPKTHSFDPKTHTLVSFPLHAEVARTVRPALLMLLGAVGFVLLIACVNVANLLLARAEARRHEVAIRGALGAQRWRLVRQFATEGVMLSVAGAALGLCLTVGGLRLIQLTNAGAIPRSGEINVDWHVLLFTMATAILTGLVFGMAPVLSLLIGDFAQSLRETGTSSTGSKGSQMIRRLLVAGELSLALVLLIGCGLMTRAFWRLQTVDVGFEPAHVVSMAVALPTATYKRPEDVDGFWGRLEERLSNIPGVRSAALAYGLPPLRPPNMNDTDIEGFVHKEGGPIENVDYYQVVSKDYFKTMGIRLMSGRLFEARDTMGQPDVVVINETMAQTFWPGQDAVGKRIRPGSSDPWCTVVGVVEDTKNAGVDHPTGTELYLPYGQKQGSNTNSMNIVVRADGDPLTLVPSVRREVQAMDSTLPVSNVQLMDDVVAGAQSRPRFLTILLSLFSIVAVSIATIGIYGIVSYSVARRTREFGLRLALGAQSKDVLGLVMRQGAIMTATGIVCGLVAAVVCTRLMRHILYQITPTDPMTYAGVTGLLVAVALFACYIPARRATRVDPASTLRSE